MIVDTMTIEEVGNAVLKTARANRNRFEAIVGYNQPAYKKIIYRFLYLNSMNKYEYISYKLFFSFLSKTKRYIYNKYWI